MHHWYVLLTQYRSPGVYQLQDPRSRVYNFDPYLQTIMPVDEFDFNALAQYITSSKDVSLVDIAKRNLKKYAGSTSSMTAVLSHFHFLLSRWRPLNTSMISEGFRDAQKLKSFTKINSAPAAVFLRWKDGCYAIDADKEFDTSNILAMLGKSQEKFLTQPTEDFERYRVSNPEGVSEEERTRPEAYHYSTQGDFLMRSQLDAHDGRLPGSGVFDLKTRAVIPIRMDVANYEHGVGYEIRHLRGEWESYEREYFDMMRSTMLKYSLQVRMGRMDGIFMAYHNIERMFGFQYIPLPEMDQAIHNATSTATGDQEFLLSLELLNKILDRATQKFPDTSIRLHFETREVSLPYMYIFAEPITEEQADQIQATNAAEVEAFERKILGLHQPEEEVDEEEESEEESSDRDGWEDVQARVEEEMEADAADAAESKTPAVDELREQSPDEQDSDEHTDIPSGYETNAKAESEDLGSTFDNPEQSHIAGRGDKSVEIEDDDRSGGDSGVVLQREATAEEPLFTSSSGTDRFSDIQTSEDSHEAEDGLRTSVNDGEVHLTSPTDDSVPIEHVIEEGTSEGSGNEETSPQAADEPETTPEVESAETDFLDKSATESDKPANILAMTLTIRSKVNGQYVKRPQDLQPRDKWTVEYSIVDVASESRAWALYGSCQARRKQRKAATTEEREDEAESYYIRRLREFTAHGRVWRGRMNAVDRARDVAMWDGKKVPVGRTEALSDVDEYLERLYSEKGREDETDGKEEEDVQWHEERKRDLGGRLPFQQRLS